MRVKLTLFPINNLYIYIPYNPKRPTVLQSVDTVVCLWIDDINNFYIHIHINERNYVESLCKSTSEVNWKFCIPATIPKSEHRDYESRDRDSNSTTHHMS